MLGDVKSIKDANGNLVAEYKYDALGKCTIASLTGLYLGTKNPIRYRGYFYDEVTKLYYLQSRYYDPKIGRFISPDNTKYLDPTTIGGLNLYAYCNNNPVMYADPHGNFVVSAFLIGLAIGAAVGFGGTVAADYADDGKVFNGSISAVEYITNTLLGTAAGGVAGFCIATGNAGLLIDPALSLAGDVLSDAAFSILTGSNQFGSIGDYSLTFLSGFITKKFMKNKTSEFLFEAFMEPLANSIYNTLIGDTNTSIKELGYNIVVNISTFGLKYRNIKAFNWSQPLLRGFLSTFMEEYS